MDHAKVDVSPTRMSCGILELSRISDETEGALYAIASRLYHPSRGEPAVILVASDIDDETTSTNKLFAEMMNLGVAVEYNRSLPVENPKTGNFIRLYSCSVNHKVFKDWYQNQRVKKLKRAGS